MINYGQFVGTLEAIIVLAAILITVGIVYIEFLPGHHRKLQEVVGEIVILSFIVFVIAIVILVITVWGGI